MTFAWPVQVAVYARLTAAPGLAGIPVHDRVPEGTVPPYVELGELDEQPDDAHDRRGYNSSLSVHVWSAYRGRREAAELLTAVDAVLHRAPLVVPGLSELSIASAGSQIIDDPNPDLRHGIARFRIWATATASITT